MYEHLHINAIVLRWPNPNRHRPWFRRKGSDRENDGSSSDSGVNEKEKWSSSITLLSGNWRRGEGRSPAKAAFDEILIMRREPDVVRFGARQTADGWRA